MLSTHARFRSTAGIFIALCLALLSHQSMATQITIDLMNDCTMTQPNSMQCTIAQRPRFGSSGSVPLSINFTLDAAPLAYIQTTLPSSWLIVPVFDLPFDVGPLSVTDITGETILTTEKDLRPDGTIAYSFSLPALTPVHNFHIEYVAAEPFSNATFTAFVIDTSEPQKKGL